MGNTLNQGKQTLCRHTWGKGIRLEVFGLSDTQFWISVFQGFFHRGHAGDTQTTQKPRVAAFSGSQLMVVHDGAGTIEDNHQLNFSLGSALHDDNDATVKEASDDGHSYTGIIVRGGLRGDIE